MTKTACPACRIIRTAVLCVALGGAAGYAVLSFGGSRDASMLATFIAAIVPLLWQARRNRIRRDDG